ncbi:MAG: aldo/keto reductase [Dehalococcoidia bacterium]|nr:aldo/keto reductase [Dehalococcoidia bacterium]MSQ34677.1 aldo/keto reductase [Dehalococcoidia bacterium]
MRTREFGKSGLQTSVIGFGGWPMGRGQYGAFDDQQAIAAAQAAYDGGVTLFDGAAVYGWGYGEELLGKAIKPFRKNIVLVTKGGRRWLKDNPDRTRAAVSDSSPEYLNEGIDESLKRLDVEYIDLFLIHWPDPSRPYEVPMRALEAAKKSGKIRHYGVSNFHTDMLAECLKHGHPVCDQVGYHMFDRRPEAGTFPFVQKNGMGIMAYGSMAHGLLAGAWKPGHTFSEDDWRRNGKNFGLTIWAPENLPANLAVVDQLKKIASDHKKTMAQLAVAWVLADPAVTVALCGAKRPAEIKEDLGGDWVMSGSLRDEINKLVLSEGKGNGKVGDPGPP